MLLRLLGALSLLSPLLLCLEPLMSAPSDVHLTENNTWRAQAIHKLWMERKEMKHTPVFKYSYPGAPHVDIIFKNESASPTGSLKHRYAWALMMWAVLEGHVVEGTTVYEASSGNTAASEAYMAKLVGVNFTAVVPDTLEQIKIDHIHEHGGKILQVDLGERLKAATKAADENNGFFMNQFAHADKAEEFHESGDFQLESVNIFHEIMYQLHADPAQVVKAPHYFVHAAGTGGTISSVGRYTKKYGVNTEVVMADTQFSVYADYVKSNRFSNESGAQFWVRPGMAGIGYGTMGACKHGQTTSLDRAVIDRIIKVPDIASTAAMEVLRRQGINGGTSTGLNFLASLSVAANDKRNVKNRLTVVTLLADPAHYYETSYYNRTWIQQNFKNHGGLKAYECWIGVIEDVLQNGGDPLIIGHAQCNFERFDHSNPENDLRRRRRNILF